MKKAFLYSSASYIFSLIEKLIAKKKLGLNDDDIDTETIMNYFLNMSNIQKNQNNNLIIFSTGDKSFHSDWISGKKRKFDLMLIYYGNEINNYRKEADYYLELKRMFKLENIAVAIQEHIDVVKKYDYIWLPDNDMIINTPSINRLFEIFHEYDLDLAQPTLRSGISHKITKTRPGYILRYTNFVDIGCPIFKIDLLLKVLPFFTLTRSGWGIDYLWSSYCENNKKKMAMIDCISLYHKSNLKNKNDESSTYYRKLKELHIDPSSEMNSILSRYNLSKRHKEYGSIKL